MKIKNENKKLTIITLQAKSLSRDFNSALTASPSIYYLINFTSQPRDIDKTISALFQPSMNQSTN